MSAVHPSVSRFKIKERADSFHITLPAKRNWLHVVYMGGFAFVGVVFAVMLVMSLFAVLMSGKNSEAPLPSMPGVCWPLSVIGVVVIIGFVGLRSVLWQFFGKETIEVRPQFLKIGRELLGFRRSKEYVVEAIRNLRTFSSERGRFEWDTGALLWNSVQGTIGFDYGARVVRFASDLNVAEAKQILAAIQQRFPQYRN